MVEKELTAFIKRRDRQRQQTEGERQIEEAWKESERRYDERRRRREDGGEGGKKGPSEGGRRA
jgi:hypothetical protein